MSDTQTAIAERETQDGAGQGQHDAPPTIAVARLRELQFTLQGSQRASTRIINQARAHTRRRLGFSTDLPEKERNRIATQAAALVAAIGKGEIPDDLADPGVVKSVAPTVLAAFESVAPWHTLSKNTEKAMVKCAETLPVAEWAKSVRGFGLLRLATIIGETGDLSGYPNPGKVWKRLGLAPYEGKAYSSWRMDGGLTSEEWVGAGYCPRRRSVAYLVGECLIKSNGDGPYKALYDEHRARDLAAHPEPEPAAKGQCRKQWTPMHMHKRAHRYITKRLVRNLWRAWNGGHHASGTQDVAAPGPGRPEPESDGAE